MTILCCLTLIPTLILIITTPNVILDILANKGIFSIQGIIEVIFCTLLALNLTQSIQILIRKYTPFIAIAFIFNVSFLIFSVLMSIDRIPNTVHENAMYFLFVPFYCLLNSLLYPITYYKMKRDKRKNTIPVFD